MARYFDIHPDNPQRRSISQVADMVRGGGVIAYLTDSCYALGCQLGNTDGLARLRAIRGLDDKHHLTLVCRDFAQLGKFAEVPNSVFRASKAATPGSYTFIPAPTHEVPRRLPHPGTMPGPRPRPARAPPHQIQHQFIRAGSIALLLALLLR